MQYRLGKRILTLRGRMTINTHDFVRIERRDGAYEFPRYRIADQSPKPPSRSKTPDPTGATSA